MRPRDAIRALVSFLPRVPAPVVAVFVENAKRILHIAKLMGAVVMLPLRLVIVLFVLPLWYTMYTLLVAFMAVSRVPASLALPIITTFPRIIPSPFRLLGNSFLTMVAFYWIVSPALNVISLWIESIHGYDLNTELAKHNFPLDLVHVRETSTIPPGQQMADQDLTVFLAEEDESIKGGARTVCDTCHEFWDTTSHASIQNRDTRIWGRFEKVTNFRSGLSGLKKTAEAGCLPCALIWNSLILVYRQIQSANPSFEKLHPDNGVDAFVCDGEPLFVEVRHGKNTKVNIEIFSGSSTY
jgi:hypothetical protein